MGRFSEPRLLAERDAVEGFDSGVPSLDTWLVEHAMQAGRAGSARAYVVTDAEQGERVVGYHALLAASVERAKATARSTRGMPNEPVPAVLAARLAVDRTVQGRGLGGWLLQDAMRRALSVSEELGVRVLLVHAANASAKRFYERFGFETSPSDPLNLQLAMKDLRRTLDAPG